MAITKEQAKLIEKTINSWIADNITADRAMREILSIINDK